MNKIIIRTSKGLKIVGNLFSVNSSAIIIMAHGFTNNKSSDHRFDSLSVSLNNSGYDVLAIDFSGCGESDAAAITSENQEDDLKSTIEYALLNGYSEIALFGNSFGTLICLRSYREEIKTMVLVGAVTDSMYYNWREYFTEDQMNDISERGYFYFTSDREHKITKQTLMDYEEINQEKLLSDIDCPILIIHGDNAEDKEELQLLERSKKALCIMTDDSRLEVIKDGKHGLLNHWNKVIDVTCSWYNKQLS